jgi:hypothetical protein
MQPLILSVAPCWPPCASADPFREIIVTGTGHHYSEFPHEGDVVRILGDLADVSRSPTAHSSVVIARPCSLDEPGTAAAVVPIESKEPWYRTSQIRSPGLFVVCRPTENRSAFLGLAPKGDTSRVDLESNTSRDRYDWCSWQQPRYSLPAGRRPTAPGQRPRAPRAAAGPPARASAGAPGRLAPPTALGLVANRLSA